MTTDELVELWDKLGEVYLSKEHREKYSRLAKEKGIAITDLSLLGIKDKEHLERLLKEDGHLNNINLRNFDGLTLWYNLCHPGECLTLSEGCCIYKELLRQIVEGENV